MLTWVGFRADCLRAFSPLMVLEREAKYADMELVQGKLLTGFFPAHGSIA